MHLYTRSKSPYIWFEVEVDGRRFRESTEETTERKARKVAEKRVAELKQLAEKAKELDFKPMSIETAADLWWRHVGAHTSEDDLGPFSMDLDPAIAKRPINWLVHQLGRDKLVCKITAADIERLIEKRRERSSVSAGRDERGQPISRPITLWTLNRTVPRLLRRIMNYAAQNHDQQLKAIKWRDLIKKPPKRPIEELSITTEAQLDREGVERKAVRSLRRFMTLTGMRVGAALRLTWRQVDFVNECYRVVLKNKVPKEKTMDAETRALLWELWTDPHRHPTHVFSYVCKRTGVNPKTGKRMIRGHVYPMTYAYLVTASERDWGKVGLKMRRHDLRHTFGRRTLRETGDLDAVSRLMDHSSVAITAEFYQDADKERERDVLKRRNEGVARRRAEVEAKAAELEAKSVATSGGTKHD
jgi:integrase